jgi:hypothetical protein
MRTTIIAGSFASSLLILGGCAHHEERRVDEAQLGNLSMAQKHDVFTAQHNVEVAQANRMNAERAGDEANSFRAIAGHELVAAKSRAKAAARAVDLLRSTGDEHTRAAADHNLGLASREVAAAQAKREYADSLFELRDAEVALADRKVDAAEAERALVGVEALRRAGIMPRERLGDVVRERDAANAEVLGANQHVADLRDGADRLRVEWAQRDRAFNVASRMQGPQPIPPPPPPPRTIPAEPIGQPQNE